MRSSGFRKLPIKFRERLMKQAFMIGIVRLFDQSRRDEIFVELVRLPEFY